MKLDRRSLFKGLLGLPLVALVGRPPKDEVRVAQVTSGYLPNRFLTGETYTEASQATGTGWLISLQEPT